MRTFRQRFIDWIEHRTGLETAIRNFLFEDIPASSGWHNVFGSVAVFLFLVQAFTGILLAFNYAPTPGDAYNSLKYIMAEVTGGELLRGLHHWGASLLIVAAVAHMTQVFLFGAYKKPREATWMVGVCLLLLTLAYGLTGYLLPWDNRAYWGTVVTTQLASKAPLIGSYLTRILGSEASIGVVTFARFYALHVLLLPPITTGLIVLHIYLVRKHGVAPAPGDERPKKKFFPAQVFKDTVSIFVAFIFLFIMAVAVQVPLGRLADPTDTAYIPRPDWYFLFLFQILKLFEGPLEAVGSALLPTLAILALFAVPFFDRGAVKRLAQRTAAIGVATLAAVGWGALTLTAVLTTPKPADVSREGGATVHNWQTLTPDELAGLGYFREEHCSVCHNLTPGPPRVGPDLASAAKRRTPAWMIEHFRDPSRLMPGTPMPPTHLEDAQLATLAAFLFRLNPQNAEIVTSAPAYAVKGAMIYQNQKCGSCHLANGQGMKVGPTLNGLFLRRTKDWVEVQIQDPTQHLPDSIMPAFQLPPTEMRQLIDYLFSLPPLTAPSQANLRPGVGLAAPQ